MNIFNALKFDKLLAYLILLILLTNFLIKDVHSLLPLSQDSLIIKSSQHGVINEFMLKFKSDNTIKANNYIAVKFDYSLKDFILSSLDNSISCIISYYGNNNNIVIPSKFQSSIDSLDDNIVFCLVMIDICSDCSISVSVKILNNINKKRTLINNTGFSNFNSSFYGGNIDLLVVSSYKKDRIILNSCINFSSFYIRSYFDSLALLKNNKDNFIKNAVKNNEVFISNNNDKNISVLSPYKLIPIEIIQTKIDPLNLYILSSFTVTLQFKLNIYIPSDATILFEWDNTYLSSPSNCKLIDSYNTLEEEIKETDERILTSLKPKGRIYCMEFNDKTNVLILKGIEENINPEKVITVVFYAFKTKQYTTEPNSSTYIKLNILYSNSYSLIASTYFNIINIKRPDLEYFSFKQSQGLDIYKNGAFQIEFEFLSNVTISKGLFVSLIHSNYEPNINKINFIASTCDFNTNKLYDYNIDLENNSSTSNNKKVYKHYYMFSQDINSRPMCMQMSNSHIFENNLGSGIFFYIKELNEGIIYKFKVFIFTEHCGGLITNYNNKKNSQDNSYASSNYSELEFTLSFTYLPHNLNMSEYSNNSFKSSTNYLYETFTNNKYKIINSVKSLSTFKCWNSQSSVFDEVRNKYDDSFYYDEYYDNKGYTKIAFNELYNFSFSNINDIEECKQYKYINIDIFDNNDTNNFFCYENDIKHIYKKSLDDNGTNNNEHIQINEGTFFYNKDPKLSNSYRGENKDQYIIYENSIQNSYFSLKADFNFKYIKDVYPRNLILAPISLIGKTDETSLINDVIKNKYHNSRLNITVNSNYLKLHNYLDDCFVSWGGTYHNCIYSNSEGEIFRDDNLCPLAATVQSDLLDIDSSSNLSKNFITYENIQNISNNIDYNVISIEAVSSIPYNEEHKANKDAPYSFLEENSLLNEITKDNKHVMSLEYTFNLFTSCIKFKDEFEYAYENDLKNGDINIISQYSYIDIYLKFYSVDDSYYYRVNRFFKFASEVGGGMNSKYKTTIFDKNFAYFHYVYFANNKETSACLLQISSKQFLIDYVSTDANALAIYLHNIRLFEVDYPFINKDNNIKLNNIYNESLALDYPVTYNNSSSSSVYNIKSIAFQSASITDNTTLLKNQNKLFISNLENQSITTPYMFLTNNILMTGINKYNININNNNINSTNKNVNQDILIPTYCPSENVAINLLMFKTSNKSHLFKSLENIIATNSDNKTNNINYQHSPTYKKNYSYFHKKNNLKISFEKFSDLNKLYTLYFYNKDKVNVNCTGFMTFLSSDVLLYNYKSVSFNISNQISNNYNISKRKFYSLPSSYFSNSVHGTNKNFYFNGIGFSSAILSTSTNININILSSKTDRLYANDAQDIDNNINNLNMSGFIKGIKRISLDDMLAQYYNSVSKYLSNSSLIYSDNSKVSYNNKIAFFCNSIYEFDTNYLSNFSLINDGENKGSFLLDYIIENKVQWENADISILYPSSNKVIDNPDINDKFIPVLYSDYNSFKLNIKAPINILPIMKVSAKFKGFNLSSKCYISFKDNIKSDYIDNQSLNYECKRSNNNDSTIECFFNYIKNKKINSKQFNYFDTFDIYCYNINLESYYNEEIYNKITKNNSLIDIINTNNNYYSLFKIDNISIHLNNSKSNLLFQTNSNINKNLIFNVNNLLEKNNKNFNELNSVLSFKNNSMLISPTIKAEYVMSYYENSINRIKLKVDLKRNIIKDSTITIISNINDLFITNETINNQYNKICVNDTNEAITDIDKKNNCSFKNNNYNTYEKESRKSNNIIIPRCLVYTEENKQPYNKNTESSIGECTLKNLHYTLNKIDIKIKNNILNKFDNSKLSSIIYIEIWPVKTLNFGSKEFFINKITDNFNQNIVNKDYMIKLNRNLKNNKSDKNKIHTTFFKIEININKNLIYSNMINYLSLLHNIDIYNNLANIKISDISKVNNDNKYTIDENKIENIVDSLILLTTEFYKKYKYSLNLYNKFYDSKNMCVITHIKPYNDLDISSIVYLKININQLFLNNNTYNIKYKLNQILLFLPINIVAYVNNIFCASEYYNKQPNIIHDSVFCEMHNDNIIYIYLSKKIISNIKDTFSILIYGLSFKNVYNNNKNLEHNNLNDIENNILCSLVFSNNIIINSLTNNLSKILENNQSQYKELIIESINFSSIYTRHKSNIKFTLQLFDYSMHNINNYRYYVKNYVYPLAVTGKIDFIIKFPNSLNNLNYNTSHFTINEYTKEFKINYLDINKNDISESLEFKSNIINIVNTSANKENNIFNINYQNTHYNRHFECKLKIISKISKYSHSNVTNIPIESCYILSNSEIFIKGLRTNLSNDNFYIDDIAKGQSDFRSNFFGFSIEILNINNPEEETYSIGDFEVTMLSENISYNDLKNINTVINNMYEDKINSEEKLDVNKNNENNLITYNTHEKIKEYYQLKFKTFNYLSSQKYLNKIKSINSYTDISFYDPYSQYFKNNYFVRNVSKIYFDIYDHNELKNYAIMTSNNNKNYVLKSNYISIKRGRYTECRAIIRNFSKTNKDIYLSINKSISESLNNINNKVIEKTTSIYLKDKNFNLLFGNELISTVGYTDLLIGGEIDILHNMSFKIPFYSLNVNEFIENVLVTIDVIYNASNYQNQTTMSNIYFNNVYNMIYINEYNKDNVNSLDLLDKLNLGTITITYNKNIVLSRYNKISVILSDYSYSSLNVYFKLKSIAINIAINKNSIYENQGLEINSNNLINDLIDSLEVVYNIELDTKNNIRSISYSLNQASLNNKNYINNKSPINLINLNKDILEINKRLLNKSHYEKYSRKINYIRKEIILALQKAKEICDFFILKTVRIDPGTLLIDSHLQIKQIGLNKIKDIIDLNKSNKSIIKYNNISLKYETLTSSEFYRIIENINEFTINLDNKEEQTNLNNVSTNNNVLDISEYILTDVFDNSKEFYNNNKEQNLNVLHFKYKNSINNETIFKYGYITCALQCFFEDDIQDIELINTLKNNLIETNNEIEHKNKLYNNVKLNSHTSNNINWLNLVNAKNNTNLISAINNQFDEKEIRNNNNNNLNLETNSTPSLSRYFSKFIYHDNEINFSFSIARGELYKLKCVISDSNQINIIGKGVKKSADYFFPLLDNMSIDTNINKQKSSMPQLIKKSLPLHSPRILEPICIRYEFEYRLPKEDEYKILSYCQSIFDELKEGCILCVDSYDNKTKNSNYKSDVIDTLSIKSNIYDDTECITAPQLTSFINNTYDKYRMPNKLLISNKRGFFSGAQINNNYYDSPNKSIDKTSTLFYNNDKIENEEYSNYYYMICASSDNRCPTDNKNLLTNMQVILSNLNSNIQLNLILGIRQANLISVNLIDNNVYHQSNTDLNLIVVDNYNPIYLFSDILSSEIFDIIEFKNNIVKYPKISNSGQISIQVKYKNPLVCYIKIQLEKDDALSYKTEFEERKYEVDFLWTSSKKITAYDIIKCYHISRCDSFKINTFITTISIKETITFNPGYYNIYTVCKRDLPNSFKFTQVFSMYDFNIKITQISKSKYYTDKFNFISGSILALKDINIKCLQPKTALTGFVMRSSFNYINNNDTNTSNNNFFKNISQSNSDIYIEGDNFYYEYTCGYHTSITNECRSISSYFYDYYTIDPTSSILTLVYLKLKCNNNEVLKQFNLEEKNNQIRYLGTCCIADVAMSKDNYNYIKLNTHLSDIKVLNDFSIYNLVDLEVKIDRDRLINEMYLDIRNAKHMNYNILTKKLRLY